MTNDFTPSEVRAVKEIILKDGKYNLTRVNPYGFIKISAERGQLPDKLKGWYTTWEDAERDLTMYLQTKGREVIEKR